MTKLYYQNGCFVCDTNQCTIPDSAGLTFAKPIAGKWATQSPWRAACLLKYAEEPKLVAYLTACLNHMRTNGALSRAESPLQDGPALPEELPGLFEFQKSGLQYLLSNEGILLADEMGLGKTVQAIALLNSLPELKKALIVCPASIKLNWRNELQKWLKKPLTIGVGFGTTLPSCDILIVNYDILQKNEEYLCSEKWDCIIGDESCAIKNPKSHRARSFLKLKAKKRVLLNGTPILNRPAELWTSLRWLDPLTWSNWYKFSTRYCGAFADRYGLHTDGATNIEELSSFLRSTCMVMRKKSQVMKHLPPKLRQVIEIPCSDQSIINTEKDALQHYNQQRLLYQAAKRDASLMRDERMFSQRLHELRQSIHLAFNELSKARHDVAVYKIPAIIEHLKGSQCGQTIFFAHHKDVISALREVFPEALYMTSDLSTQQRQSVIEKFATRESSLMISSLKLGFGWNATTSHHVVFGELDWTPAVLTQCEDRVHRYGQNAAHVLIQYLVIEGSVDAMVAKKLSDKQEVINEFSR